MQPDDPQREVPALRTRLPLGVSQSGRFLCHFLELGINDGGGRRVFDGVLAHVAGAGKVSANHSFAMTGRTTTQHEDRSYPENTDPMVNTKFYFAECLSFSQAKCRAKPKIHQQNHCL
ncbi:MAG TPA: hypothetical protein VGI28_12480 [Stellaceae bacterium]